MANAVTQVTLTETPNDAGATVAYLDGTDTALIDADTTADGFQVEVSVGSNTIKVKVTAEDMMATETCTVTVYRAEPDEKPDAPSGRTVIWEADMTVCARIFPASLELKPAPLSSWRSGPTSLEDIRIRRLGGDWSLSEYAPGNRDDERQSESHHPLDQPDRASQLRSQQLHRCVQIGLRRELIDEFRTNGVGHCLGLFRGNPGVFQLPRVA